MFGHEHVVGMALMENLDTRVHQLCPESAIESAPPMMPATTAKIRYISADVLMVRRVKISTPSGRDATLHAHDRREFRGEQTSRWLSMALSFVAAWEGAFLVFEKSTGCDGRADALPYADRSMPKHLVGKGPVGGPGSCARLFMPAKRDRKPCTRTGRPAFKPCDRNPTPAAHRPAPRWLKKATWV